MYLSTFRHFQKQLREETHKKTGQQPSDVIYVFIDLKLCMHTHQDNGTPHLYRALRDKKQLFIGGAAFTKIPMGDKVIDRVTPMWCALPEDFREQAQALLYAAAKSWLALPEGTPAGVVPCHVDWKAKAGLHIAEINYKGATKQ